MSEGIKRFEREVAGRKLIIEVGHFAQQAGGSCTVQYGDTVVLATATMGKNVREELDYFPLSVDFEERLYAAGKIKGSRWIKREGRPSDGGILSGRMIDRSVRPLFDDSIRNEVQVVITMLSYDGENNSDVASVIGASTALMISNIPWNGPLGAVKIGYKDGQYIVNPSDTELNDSLFELFVSARRGHTVMIEAEGKEVSEEIMYGAITKAHEEMGVIIDLIEEVHAAVGREKIKPKEHEFTPEELVRRTAIEKFVHEYSTENLVSIWGIRDKVLREEKTSELFDNLKIKLKKTPDTTDEELFFGKKLLNELMEKDARRLVLEEGRRVDGRGLDEVRPLSSQVAVLPRVHGSGLFQRGETQVLSLVTLGAPGDEQFLDGVEESGTKRYMHHYNFPPYSVGEVKVMRGPGRREIGHGALAEKALVPVIPSKEEFPYTVRVVSEVLGSNGSSSQASICGSSLALMDAGVPIKAPVAGIAIGLVTNDDESEYKILTDIQGIEDHAFDMDYKVAGTRNGITAIQLDIKLNGIPLSASKDALEKAKIARLQILDVMEATIAAPRAELSQYAPRIEVMHIDPEKIRTVIGKGGETITGIIEECGGRDICKIDIEDDGLVLITSTDQDMGKKAKTMIENLTRDIKEGEIFEGPVVKIVTDQMGKEIGAIVELVPGQDGMVHISEMNPNRINKISDAVKLGDIIKVKVLAVDKERGRISLSHRDFAEPIVVELSNDEGGDRGGFGGGRRGFRGGQDGGRDRGRGRGRF